MVRFRAMIHVANAATQVILQRHQQKEILVMNILELLEDLITRAVYRVYFRNGVDETIFEHDFGSHEA